MEPIMSPKLKKEQDAIFEQWLATDEDIGLFDYAIKYSSDELRLFLINERERKEKYRKMGIIIN